MVRQKSLRRRTKLLDLNQNKEKVVLLIHPMLSSAHGMKLIIADHMGEEFRYILPDILLLP